MKTVAALVSSFALPAGGKAKAQKALKDALAAQKHAVLPKSAGPLLVVTEARTGVSYALVVWPGTEAKLRAELEEVLETGAFRETPARLLLAGGPEELAPDLAFFFADTPLARLQARLLGNSPNAIELGIVDEEWRGDAEVYEQERDRNDRSIDTTGEPLLHLSSAIWNFGELVRDLAFVVREAAKVTVDATTGAKALAALDKLVLAARPEGLGKKAVSEDALPPWHVLTALTLLALDALVQLRPGAVITPPIDAERIPLQTTAPALALDLDGASFPVGKLLFERWRTGAGPTLAKAWEELAPKLPAKQKVQGSRVKPLPPGGIARKQPVQQERGQSAAPSAPAAPTTVDQALELLANRSTADVALTALARLDPERFAQEARALLDAKFWNDWASRPAHPRIFQAIYAHAHGPLLKRALSHALEASGSDAVERADAQLLGRTGEGAWTPVTEAEQPRLAEVFAAIVARPQKKGEYPYSGRLLAEAMRHGLPGAMERFDQLLHGDYAGFVERCHLDALGEKLGADAEPHFRYLLQRSVKITEALEACAEHTPAVFQRLLKEQLAAAQLGKLTSRAAGEVHAVARRLGDGDAFAELVREKLSYRGSVEELIEGITGVHPTYGGAKPIQPGAAAKLRQAFAVAQAEAKRRKDDEPLQTFVEGAYEMHALGPVLDGACGDPVEIVAHLESWQRDAGLVEMIVNQFGSVDPARVTGAQLQVLGRIFAAYRKQPPDERFSHDASFLQGLTSTGLVARIDGARELLLARLANAGQGDELDRAIRALATAADPKIDELILSVPHRTSARTAVFARVGDDALWQRFATSRAPIVQDIVAWSSDRRWVPHAFELLGEDEPGWDYLTRVLTPDTVAPLVEKVRAQGLAAAGEKLHGLARVGGEPVVELMIDCFEAAKTDDAAATIVAILPSSPVDSVLGAMEKRSRRARTPYLREQALERIRDLRELQP